MLRLQGVSHAYGDIVSLRDVSLDVVGGEILCLLGPSGCGKTTLLRIIAGLETEYEGVIAFHGEDIRPIPAHERGFGLMFQDFALFPHLSVADNIAYGLKRLGLKRKAIGNQVESLLARVGLADLDERDVASLSGGQQQRVALARSLAPNPRLLMLDEPLGSLDAQLRDQLALELRRIVKNTGLSAIYVTHDHREAYAVADRIAVMNMGSVKQHDKPRDLYRRPRCKFVARFLGMTNVYPNSDSRILNLLGVTQSWRSLAGSILIHPAGIKLSDDIDSSALSIDSIVESVVFRGGFIDVTVLTETDLRISFALADLSLSVGDKIRISVSRDAIIPLEESHV
ncbi:MAG: ABC transporter ATP-binding protein [Chloroflexi bacterium]|nr:ABC transporter ATP-binding protein [Chloroflexota bacterium]